MSLFLNFWEIFSCVCPAPFTDSDDWLELYNNSNELVDISGWILMDGNDEHVYNFPEAFELDVDEYIVFCDNIIVMYKK